LGYGVFKLDERNCKLDLGVLLSGTVETGVKWNIGIGTALYTGIFMDYGLNNTLKSSYFGKRFVEYNRMEPEKPLMNTACVLTNRFSPMSFGIKLKLSFSVGCSDWLNDRRAYRTMQLNQENDFYDFDVQNQTPETAPPIPAAVPADTVRTATSTETALQPDTTILNAEAVKECRNPISVSSIGSVKNYNCGTVMLTAEQKLVLDDYIEVLTGNPQAYIEITGHTCDLGTDRVNMRIGLKRADSARNYLVEKGIAPSRIQTFSEGESKPLFPNGSEENRRKNRRLEIKLNR
jgi:outer membrane protein OmpA-like peptidoglycan-associated protein